MKNNNKIRFQNNIKMNPKLKIIEKNQLQSQVQQPQYKNFVYLFLNQQNSLMILQIKNNEIMNNEFII